jgi:predicted alpha/beta-hydrolase family hydrolase
MLLLFPGAGSDASHASLRAVEQWVAPHPCRRVDFPYRIAGRRAPDRAPVLMASVREAIAGVDPDETLVLGGRSMGGRICSMVAAGVDGLPPPKRLRGLVLVSYPLHPPGKPDRLRVEHFPDISIPTLFVSGDRDTFATPDELRAWTATMPKRAKVRHLFIEGRGHDLKGSDQTIAGAVADFLELVL